MNTTLIVAGIASALLLGATAHATVGPTGGKNGYGSPKGQDRSEYSVGGGGMTTGVRTYDHGRGKAYFEKVPPGTYTAPNRSIFRDKNSSSGPQGAGKTGVGKHHTN